MLRKHFCKCFVNHSSHLWKMSWICLVFAGWITFTKRFKSTNYKKKTTSLNMVLATLLEHLPKLTDSVLKTSLKYFFITIFSNVWQTFSYCLMKCYQFIGKVFWKSIICKHFINVLETLSNFLITFQKHCQTNVIIHFFIQPLKNVIKMLCVCCGDKRSFSSIFMITWLIINVAVVECRKPVRKQDSSLMCRNIPQNALSLLDNSLNINHFGMWKVDWFSWRSWLYSGTKFAPWS